MNPIINMLMGRLQKVNPNGYNLINQAMKNNGDPNALLQQIMGNSSPQQRQQILNTAKSYGAPNDVLSKIQNMK